MQSRLLRFLVPMLLFPFLVIGQCFDQPLPSGSDCSSAQFLCGYYMDGFCGQLVEMPPQGTQPEDLCNNSGDVDNIQWFSFIACDTNVEFVISPSNCQAVLSTQSGLQAGVYEDCGFDTAIFCYSDSGESDITVALSDMIPGNIYYLFIDGYAGSVCDFCIDVIDGIDTTEPEEVDVIMVDIVATPDTICENGSTNVSFEIPNLNIGGNGNASSCGGGGSSQNDLDYLVCIEWYINGNLVDGTANTNYSVNGPHNQNTISVVFPTEGSYIFTSIVNYNPAVFGDQDNGATSCTAAEIITIADTVVVLPTELIILDELQFCEGESFDYCETTYTSSALAECMVACTTFIQPITFLPTTFIDNGTIYTCANTCYTFQSVDYCTPGVYEVNDQDDCSVRYVFTIIDIDDPLSYSGNQMISCTQATLTLDPVFTLSNISDISYIWTDNNGQEIGSEAALTVGTSGFYTLTVYSPSIIQGCEPSISIPIQQDDNVPVLEIISPILNCDEPSQEIQTISDRPLQSITWSGPDSFESNDLAPMISDTGIYTVTVIASNGCEATELVHVQGDFAKPQIDPVYQDLNCYQEWSDLSYTSDLAIRSQLWSSTEFSSTELSTQTSLPGIYTLEATAFNGCITEMPFEIKDERIYPVADAGMDALWYCDTESIDIQATIETSNNFVTSWTTIAGAPLDLIDDENIKVTSTGSYELSVMNTELGCITRDTVEVRDNEDLPNGFIGEIADPMCYQSGDGYILLEQITGGQGPYEVAIDGLPAELQSPMTDLSPGEHTIMIRDAHGCEFSESFTLTDPDDIIIDLPEVLDIKYYSTGTLKVNHDLDLDDLDGVYWYDIVGNPIGEGETIEVSETYTTTYTVVVISKDGCSASAEIEIRVDSVADVYVPNIFSPNGDGNNDLFWVQGEDADLMIESLLIYDRWGNNVYTANNMLVGEDAQGWDGTYQGRPVNPGVYVYLLEMRTANGELLVKSGDITVVK